jgi:hypothetical protein
MSLTNFPVRINRLLVRLSALQNPRELTLPQIMPEWQVDNRAMDGSNK